VAERPALGYKRGPVIDAIAFDFDGTLADTREAVVALVEGTR
jgi:hypothetical protein